MTPRTNIAAAEPATPTEDALLNYVDGLLDEAAKLREVATAAVVEESFTRLVRCRACLDRLDGIREDLARLTSERRYLHIQERDAHEEAVASSSERYAEGLAVRGLSYDERRMRFVYANRPALRRVQALGSSLRYLEDALSLVSSLVAAVDRSRLEALTLFRAGRSITADEYAHSVEA